MSVPHQLRPTWTRRPNAADRQVGKRRGVALHWPGFRFNLGGHADCLQMVERLEREAIAHKGYAAVPYNEFACPHGYRIEGRGVDRRSGANGDRAVNVSWGSVCALLPIDGKPTDGMLRAIRDALRAQAPNGKLVTHNAVRPEPTSCPGPVLSKWVRDGAHAPRADEPPKPARKTHKVVKGDTLWSLAERFYNDGTKANKIAKANGIADADELSVGDRLVIP